jgi:ankyrin repeat protein
MDSKPIPESPPARPANALDKLPTEVLVVVLSHIRWIDLFAVKLAGSRRLYRFIRSNLYSLPFDEYVRVIEEEGRLWPAFCDHFALSLAAARGQTSLVKEFYHRAADSAERQGRAFSSDSATWDIFPSQTDCRTVLVDRRNALEWAAGFGRDDIVELFLNTPSPKPPKNMTCRSGMRRFIFPPSSGTAMHFAAAGGHESTVRLLRTAGFRFDSAGQCAIAWAAQSGQDRMVKFLLDNGAALTSNAAIAAAKHGQVGTVKTLIDAGVSLRLPDARLGTALHYAASNGDEEMVRLLLVHGGNPLQRDKDDKSPLDLAFAHGHAAVAKILLMHTRPDNIHPSTLSLAAAHGHVACVKMLLALGAPNCGSEQREGAKSPQPWILESCSASLRKGYFPAIHEAAAACQPSIVSLLLESGPDYGRYDSTALRGFYIPSPRLRSREIARRCGCFGR